MSDDSTEPQAIDDREIQYLATGFALGDLDETELQRLYDVLRRPDQSGTNAARITWQVLGTTVDLRSSMSTQFQDTVRQRLQDAQDASAERRFLGGLFGRIGRRQPHLESVRLPASQPARKGLLIAIAAVLLAIGCGLWWMLANQEAERPQLATLIALQGSVSVEGVQIQQGATLDDRLCAVPKGSKASLELKTGHRIDVLGPATLQIVNDNSVSLSHGQAVIRATGPLAIGLPDRQLRLSQSGQLNIEVRDQRSLIAMEDGQANWQQGLESNSRELTQGQVLGRDSRQFKRVVIHDMPKGAALASDPSATVWSTAMHLACTERQARLSITDTEGNTITIAGDHVLVTNKQGEEQKHTLRGPPLRRRHCLFECTGDKHGHLQIDGIDSPIAIPNLSPVMRFDHDHSMVISDFVHVTGPKVLSE